MVVINELKKKPGHHLAHEAMRKRGFHGSEMHNTSKEDYLIVIC